MFDDVIMQDQVQEPVTEQPEAIVQSEPESDKARNMRFLRESKERAERERDEAYRRIQELERQSKSPDPEEAEPDPDALVEWRHVSKKIRNLEGQIKNQQQAAYEYATESRLKSQFSDFDKVVSKENIETLKDMHPEIAQTLSQSNDMYIKFASAYKIIRNLGIYKDQASDPYEEDRARAQRNSAKPRPLAAVSPQQGDSPLSNANAFANGLTEDLKKNLLKEMMEMRKGY